MKTRLLIFVYPVLIVGMAIPWSVLLTRDYPGIVLVAAGVSSLVLGVVVTAWAIRTLKSTVEADTDPASFESTADRDADAEAQSEPPLVGEFSLAVVTGVVFSVLGLVTAIVGNPSIALGFGIFAGAQYIATIRSDMIPWRRSQ